MSVKEEFTEFIAGGSVVDIAVGFVMGAAFAALIGALVDNIIMPIIAIPFGEPSFDAIIWTINDSQILVGSFVTAIVAFVSIALGMFFFVVKPMNAYRSRTAAEEDESEEGPSEVDLLTQIRDTLATR